MNVPVVVILWSFDDDLVIPWLSTATICHLVNVWLGLIIFISINILDLKVYSELFSFTFPQSFLQSHLHSYIHILILAAILQLYMQPDPNFLSQSNLQYTSEGVTHFMPYTLSLWVTKSLTTYCIGTKGGGNSYYGGGWGVFYEVED